MSFGYSVGDFYLFAQFVASITESFRKGPRGATPQYSNFEAEFSLISNLLGELPDENSPLTGLWASTKGQCVDFVLKYSSLAPAESRVAEGKEARWGRIYAQGLTAIAKVKWPLTAREEALTLERNMLNLVQMALLNLSTRRHHAQQRDQEKLESLLRQVQQQIAENSKEIGDQIGQIWDGVREISSLLRPGQKEKLSLRIEDIREQAIFIMYQWKSPTTSVGEGSSAISSYSLDISPPFDLLYTSSRPSEVSFNNAYDHLGLIATVMKNHVARQYGLPFPHASSIIALLTHIIKTVEVAFSSIGFQLPDEISDSPYYTANQEQLEETLEQVYENWVRFIKVAKYECERSRPLSISPTSEHFSTPLEDIVEGRPKSQWAFPVQEHRDVHDNVPPGKLRQDSKDISLETRNSNVARSSIGKTVKLLTSDADGNQKEWGKSLDSCSVSEVQFGVDHDIVFIKIRSQDQKATFHQQLYHGFTFPVTRISKNQVTEFSCRSSYEDFRTVDNTQVAHPSGAPIYVFDNEEDSYAFQTEVLDGKISGWEVIFSAETQHIVHTNTRNSCHLQDLRIIQDSASRRSIFYWEIHQPELTNGKEDFVIWSQFEFGSVIRKGKDHAILYFLDETKARRRSSGSISSIFRLRRSSKDQEHSPAQSSSVTTTPSLFGSPLDNGDWRSRRSSADPGFISTPLPPSAFEANTKAKRDMGGLDIKFWNQKDRDTFVERLGWTSPSPTV